MVFDETVIIKTIGAVLSTIGLIFLFNESRKGQKAHEAAQEAARLAAEAEEQQKPREKVSRTKSHGKRLRQEE